MRMNQISDRLAKFKPGDRVKIKWVYDDYVAYRDKGNYPKNGVVTYITERGIGIKSRAGYLSMVGIYDLAIGTTMEVVG